MMIDLRPRYDHWAAKVLTAIFLLFIGGLVNQFLNIPAQQARQDVRLDAIDRHMESEDSNIVVLQRQHEIMLKQQADLKMQMDELKAKVEEHNLKHEPHRALQRR